MRFFLLLCLFLLSIWCINVIEAVDTYSVWNTNSQTSRFCDHIRFRGSVPYQQWFNDVCDVAVHQAFAIGHLMLTNIYIANPPILHCASSSIDMFVETQYDTPQVRAGIQLYALRVKERTQEDFNIHFIVHDIGTPFGARNSDHGRYIIRHQLLVRNHLKGESVFPHGYRETLHQIAQETDVQLNNMWFVDGRIRITLLPPNTATTSNIRQFLSQAQHTLGLPVEIAMDEGRFS